MTEELTTRDGTTSETGPHPIKDGINNAIDDTVDVVSTVITQVSDGIANIYNGPGKSEVAVLESEPRVLRDAVRESLCVGRDLIVGTKAIMLGVIRGTGERGEAALQTVERTARTVIRQTAELNGDVGAAATGLVQGAIAGADQIGVEPARAATAAAGAIIGEADRIGAVLVDKVRVALKHDILGIRVL